MKKYVAIIIDIKNSKQLEKNRETVQQHLRDIVRRVNIYFEKTLVKKMEFSAGDSVQALFDDLPSAFCTYLFVRNRFRPFELRCGMGYGGIYEFANDSEFTTNMSDGEAYHLAQQALSVAKEKDTPFVLNTGNNDSLVINQIMETVHCLVGKRTEVQQVICDVYDWLCPLLSDSCQTDKYFELIESILFKANCTDLTDTFKYYYDKYNKGLQTDGLVFGTQFDSKYDEIVTEFVGRVRGKETTRQNIVKAKNAGDAETVRKLECCAYTLLQKMTEGQTND